MSQSPCYPSVDVVVVNYNGVNGGMLNRCLASIARTQYSNFRVTVVDNGSTDGSTSLVQRTCPDAHLIRNDRNLGFATASNQAFRRALGNNTDYVAIVNNDVTFPNPQWLAVGIAAAEADPRVGIVGFCNASQPGSELIQKDESAYVNYLHGCVLLIKAALIRLVGMFDERYFMYAERTTSSCGQRRRASYHISRRRGGSRRLRDQQAAASKHSVPAGPKFHPVCPEEPRAAPCGCPSD